LQRVRQPFAVVSGSGDARLQSAWRAVQHAMGIARAEGREDIGRSNWQWRCERCGDAACELHLLPRTVPPLSRV